MASNRRNRTCGAACVASALCAALGCSDAQDDKTLDLSGAIARVQTIEVDRLARNTDKPAILKLRRPQVDSQRHRAYVGGTVTPYLGVIDTNSGAIVDTIDLKIHGYLSKQLNLDTATGVLYLTTLEDQKLFRLDPDAKLISAPVDVRAGGALTVDSVNHRVYATAAGEIRAYDADLKQVPQGSIKVNGAHDIAVVPADNRLYATISGPPAQVKAFDTTTATEVKSYSLPAGIRAKSVTVDGGRIYVGCAPKCVVIVDAATGATRRVDLPAEVGGAQVWNGSLYVMTGYPFPAGYLPDADGAFGVVEVLDAVTGARKSTIRAGLQADGFGIDEQTGKMYVGDTGDSYVDIFDLATGTRTQRIDTATSIEDIAIRASDGAVVVRNRLGGGDSLLLVKDGAVSAAPSPGNWPCKTLLDDRQGVVYSLSHYDSSIAAFDFASLASRAKIDLGVAKLRTDGLSTMAFDSQARKLYAALPELAQIVSVDLGSQRPEAKVTVAGFDAKTDGPGLMQVAVNSKLGRVYLFSAPQKKVLVYDRALTLLRELDLSAGYKAAIGGDPLDLLFSDDDAGILYVGSLAYDAEARESLGRLPETTKVIAVYLPGNRLYAVDFVRPSRSGANDGHERLVELDRSTRTVLRRFDLVAFDVVKSTFAIDFDRGLAYVGYFETGALDVLRIGTPMRAAL